MTATRTRWAALGAAVAVTLGAGSIGIATATSPSDATTYQPITPCRITDTRDHPAFNIGDRNTPIGTNDTHTISAHGNPGECTDIPTTATGLQLNITAVDATLATFITVWGDGNRPNASSLNPTPGQPPTPNAVTTGLTPTGDFHVYNAFGNVDVIIDVVGLYTDHHHDDRYYTEAEVDADIDLLTAELEAQRTVAASAREFDALFISSGEADLQTVTIDVPTTGLLQIVGGASGLVGSEWTCSLSHDAVELATAWSDDSCTVSTATIVDAGTHTIRLVGSTSGNVLLGEAHLNVLFVPSGVLDAA